MQSPTVVGLGEILWDLLPSGKQLGGAPANFAFHARQLGAQSAVVSAVGRDAYGDEILDRLSAMRLDASCVAVDPDHPTGTVSVEVDVAGIPSYVIHPNVAWDFVAHSPAIEELAGRCDAVCFGSLAQRSDVSRRTIAQFLAATRPGAMRIFDINLRQSFYGEGVIRSSLQAANVLKLNDQELPIVQQMLRLSHDAESAMRQLIREFKLRLLVLTRGEHGSLLLDATGQVSHHPGHPPDKLADTVGAGDAFTAAVAIGLLQNKPLDEINDAANRLAGFVCSQPGATPAISDTLLRDLWRS